MSKISALIGVSGQTILDSFEYKLDRKTGEPAKDRDGRSLYRVAVVYSSEGDLTRLPVTLTVPGPLPKIERGAAVRLVGLDVGAFLTDRNQAMLFWSADAIEAV